MTSANRARRTLSGRLSCFSCGCSAISIYYIVYLMTSICIVIDINTKWTLWFKNIKSIENHCPGTSSTLHRNAILKVQQSHTKSRPCWWSFGLNSQAIYMFWWVSVEKNTYGAWFHTPNGPQSATLLGVFKIEKGRNIWRKPRRSCDLQTSANTTFPNSKIQNALTLKYDWKWLSLDSDPS